MSELPFAAKTPTSIGRIGLRSRDADRLAAYYREVIGLQELSRDTGGVKLGAGGRELLEIQSDPAARPDDPRSAGLFHTAFLLPSRADLGRWLGHMSRNRFAITGASDHLVSEAVYLNDPEGNGIEVYADRASEAWPRNEGVLQMATERLDIASVLAEVPEGDGGWQGAPENSVIGHVHLRVGSPSEAEAWWRDAVGLDTITRYGPSAVFMSSGGYHHHVGANSWQSAGAGQREPGRAGLAFVEVESEVHPLERELVDPWGNVVRHVQRLPRPERAAA